MKTLADVSLKTKMQASFSLILLIMVVVGWRGIVGMQDLNDQFNRLHSEHFLPGQMINQANDDLLYWNRAILNHVLAENAEKMLVYEKIMASHRTALLDGLTALVQVDHIKEKDGLPILTKVQAFVDRAIPIKKRIIALSKAGEQERARRILRTELQPLVDEIDVLFTGFLNQHTHHLDEKVSEANEHRLQPV